MTKKEIEEMQAYLVKVGVFLSKVKFSIIETDTKENIRKSVDEFLNGFQASNEDLLKNIDFTQDSEEDK